MTGRTKGRWWSAHRCLPPAHLPSIEKVTYRLHNSCRLQLTNSSTGPDMTCSICTVLHRLTTGDVKQRIIVGAIENKMAIYSPHTALVRQCPLRPLSFPKQPPTHSSSIVIVMLIRTVSRVASMTGLLKVCNSLTSITSFTQWQKKQKLFQARELCHQSINPSIHLFHLHHIVVWLQGWEKATAKWFSRSALHCTHTSWWSVKTTTTFISFILPTQIAT